MVHNNFELIDIVNNRPKGKPLITVSNHDSCCDDALTLGAAVPTSWFFFNLDRLRWLLGAREICFTKPSHSIFFRMGKVLPIVRGHGVYQQTMNEVLHELNKGNWLHLFPEGKINLEKEFIRLKWGVGRLVADAAITPVVLPFYHCGKFKNFY